MADTADNVILVFDKHHGSYNQGDRAGFSRAKAQGLVDAGIAHSAKKGKLFARKKRNEAAPQKLEVGARVKFFIDGEGDAIGEVIEAPKGNGPVRISHGDRELKVAREALTFVAAPDPNAPAPGEADTVEPQLEPSGGDDDPDADAGGDDGSEATGDANA